ncbi:MAG: hypothetical protein OEV30_12120, partial [Ignavibacteria bacterium]|nr:hypothetical protein [Ignavibacteria bacterium]
IRQDILRRLPEDNLIHPEDSLAFRSLVGGPEVDRYWFEIDTTALFSSSEIDSAVTDTSIIRTGLEDDRHYYWMLRAHNAAGWGPFTATRTFKIDILPPAPGAPLLWLPPDGSVDQPVSLSFQWTDGASSGRVTQGTIRSSPRQEPPDALSLPASTSRSSESVQHPEKLP